MFTAAVTAVAVLGVLALLSAAIMVPYLCALLLGRVLGWMFRVGNDASAQPVATALSAHELAEVDALMASSRRRLRAVERQCYRRDRSSPAVR